MRWWRWVLIGCLVPFSHAVDRRRVTVRASSISTQQFQAIQFPSNNFQAIVTRDWTEAVSGACPSGRYCPAGTTFPIGCEPGLFCPAGSSAGTACSTLGVKGLTSSPGASVCELRALGEPVTEEGVLAQLRERDARDAGRKDAPMKPADDAFSVDTTHMDPDQVMGAALSRLAALGLSAQFP